MEAITSLSQCQEAFSFHCGRENKVPDMGTWAPIIKKFSSKSIIYIIVHQYVDETGVHMDAYPFQAKDIRYPFTGSEFRSKYFDQYLSDSTIWILKKEYYSNTDVIKKLLHPAAHPWYISIFM